MSIHLSGILTAATALAVLTFTLPAHALSERECSVKYQAAKSAGALGGMKWNEFRRAQCGSDASAAPAMAPAPMPAPRTAAPAPMLAPRAAAPAPTPAPRASTGEWWWPSARNNAPSPYARDNAPSSYARANDANFPMGVSPKYASESIGKARMHTCLDQYRANKASGGNGSLKWIQKGGGYYSECNKRLGGR